MIERYLERYTKKLEPERRQQILNCELATSPLFLRVLLEELRQCGRFETLKEQIKGSIKPMADGSLAVSDLYERVLERLEGDCGVEVVRKVMSALWASRAGLSETELLGITNLAPLEWAPIDLGLEQALGRNGNRLVFDHDYLRIAVEDRYLPAEEQRRQAEPTDRANTANACGCLAIGLRLVEPQRTAAAFQPEQQQQHGATRLHCLNHQCRNARTVLAVKAPLDGVAALPIGALGP